jgi:hypothetical protein
MRDMEESQNAQQEVEKVVSETHLNFISEMYKFFGLENQPEVIPINYLGIPHLGEYIEIEGSPRIGIINLESFDIQKLLTSRRNKAGEWEDQLLLRKFVVAHETAHYLDDISNPDVFRYGKIKEIDRTQKWIEFGKKNFRREIVAELGAIAYFRKNRIKILESFVQAREFYPAWKIFKEMGENALREIATATATESDEILTPYKKIELNYNSPPEELLLSLNS